MERDQATELIHNLLRGMISKKASDMFITAGFPPAFKIDGKMTPVSQQALTSTHTLELAHSIMNDRQTAELQHRPEPDERDAPPAQKRPMVVRSESNQRAERREQQRQSQHGRDDP